MAPLSPALSSEETGKLAGCTAGERELDSDPSPRCGERLGEGLERADAALRCPLSPALSSEEIGKLAGCTAGERESDSDPSSRCGAVG
jgi:hypothetical protein